MSLRGLLKDNRFMYDFLRAFDIYPVNFKVTVTENNSLPIEQLRELEDLLKVSIHDPYIVRYAKDIDMDEVAVDHVLISDLNEIVYLLIYTRGGYINRPYAVLDDHTDLNMMERLAKNKNI